MLCSNDHQIMLKEQIMIINFIKKKETSILVIKKRRNKQTNKQI